MEQQCNREPQWKSYPFWKKVRYLTGHYIWHAVLAVFLIVIAGTWIKQDFIDIRPLLGVEMIDAAPQSPGGEAFGHFLQQTGFETNPQQVRVSKIFQLGNEKGDLKCDPHKLLICRLAEGKTDLFFWDSDVLGNDLTQNALLDLREVLPPELLKEYKDQLIYSGMLLEGGYPCGIHLKDNAWIQQNHYYQDCAVGIARDAKNKEMAAAFLQYILE